jgi:hypothetical protein
MALNKLKFNSLNVTPTAGKAVGFNSSANGLEATFSGGAMTFIKKLTASSSSTLSFVDGSSDVVLDNTYKEYIFIFKDIHPGTNAQEFLFQGNAAGGSGFDETMTTTVFNANHNEADSDTGLGYVSGSDQAQGTSFQKLTRSVGADADQSCCGTLHLFNPSSTTFVKHYISTFQEANEGNYSMNVFTAGYFNTTSAIDEIQFKFASGNIDAGTITLYGIN